MVKTLGMPLEEALPYATSQVAEGLDLLPEKGVIRPGADADILLWEPDLTLDTFVAGGEIFMKDGKVVKKGTYE